MKTVLLFVFCFIALSYGGFSSLKFTSNKNYVRVNRQANGGCSIQGKVFTQGANYINVGFQAGNYYPIMIDQGANILYFLRWTFSGGQDTTATLVDSENRASFCSDLGNRGTWVTTFDSTCTSVTFTPIGDNCEERVNALGGTWTVVSQPTCLGIGYVMESDRRTADNRAVSAIFASSRVVITTYAGEFVTFDSHLPYQGATVVRQLHSDPDITGCDSDSNVDSGHYRITYGHYRIFTDAQCGVQYCLQDDTCGERGTLYNDLTFNSYTGGSCDPSIVNGDCSGGMDQWSGHPYDCVNQEVWGGCAFCGGRAIGRDINVCFNRRGNTCQDLFESESVKLACNLAFECNRQDVNGTGHYVEEGSQPQPETESSANSLAASFVVALFAVARVF